MGTGRPVGIVKNNPNLRSSILQLGWSAFGNGWGDVVARNIVKGKLTRSYEQMNVKRKGRKKSLESE